MSSSIAATLSDPNPAPALQTALLSVSGLSKRFVSGGTLAADALSFDLQDGEMLALLGPSGCGKTTCLRMLGGFERPDAGQIWLNGRDITQCLPEERGIGFVFQDYALFPHLSVLENVKFGPLSLSRPVQGPVNLSLRPEQILLEADPTSPVEIVAREFRGHDQLYWVQDGARRLVVLSGSGVSFDVGARVRLRICDCVAPLEQH